MPFKSKAQVRWMHAAEANGEVPAGTAQHWSAETKKQTGGFKALSERVVAAGDAPVSEKSGAADGTATGAWREPDGTQTGATREPHGSYTVATRRQLHLPDGSVLDLVNPGQYKSAMNTPNPNADMLQQLRAYMRVPSPGPMAGASMGGQQTTAMPGLPGQNALNVIDMQGGLDATGQTVDGNHGAGIAKGFKMAGSVRNYRIEETQLFRLLEKRAGPPTTSLGGLFGRAVGKAGRTAAGAVRGGVNRGAKAVGGVAGKAVDKTVQFAKNDPLGAGLAVTAPAVGTLGYATMQQGAADQTTQRAAQPLPGYAGARGPQPPPPKPPLPNMPLFTQKATPGPTATPQVMQPSTKGNPGGLVTPQTGPKPETTQTPPESLVTARSNGQNVGQYTPPVAKPPTTAPTPTGEQLAKPDPTTQQPAKPTPGSDWWASLQQHPQFNNIMGSLLGMGAAGLGSHLLSSKDDREEQSGFSSMLPWLLGGGAGYYFGPELMKMLGGAGQAAPGTPPVKTPATPATPAV